MNGDVADGVNADAKRRFPAALERNISWMEDAARSKDVAVSRRMNLTLESGSIYKQDFMINTADYDLLILLQ